MKRIFLYFCAFLIPHLTMGQDIHFSQFYNSPLFVNPAYCGVMDAGNIRAATNYKNQWGSITNNPYETFAGSADMLMSPEKNKGLAAGLSFYNDRAGASDFGTSQLNVILGYIAQMNKENWLSAAISGGYANRRANVSNLKWGSQFNGNYYDPNASNGEINPYSESTYYSDFSGGLLWNYIGTDSKGAEAGIAAFNLNKPDISLVNTTQDRMYPRVVVHGGINYPLKNSNISVLPKLFYSRQGPANELLAGLLLNYNPDRPTMQPGILASSSISFGGFYRTRDAVVLVFNIELKKKFLLGISYDINISGLTVASYGKGGVEISLIYKGKYKRAGFTDEGNELPML